MITHHLDGNHLMGSIALTWIHLEILKAVWREVDICLMKRL